MRASGVSGAALLFVTWLATPAQALDCGVNEHASGDHCCRAGEEWVPAKRMCVCLDPAACGAARKSTSTSKLKKAADRKPPPPARNKVDGLKIATDVLGAFSDALEVEQMIQQLRRMDDYSRIGFAHDLVSSGKRFACDQIRRMMLTSSFDPTRLEIGAALYPAAADPQNWYQLVAAMQYPGGKWGMKQRLGQE